MKTYDALIGQRVAADGGTELAVWSGGEGPAVLLLHGYPQTAYMWRHLVPSLLGSHRVVLMDLRGYGDSDAPTPDPDDATYSKRTMASDVACVLDHLGLDRVHAVGHDRGARVVHRLCLDHPERVSTATVLDIVPTLHMFEHVDRTMAEAYFHWFFLTRGQLPVTLLRGDPDAWIRSRFHGRHGSQFTFDDTDLEVYAEAFRRPGVIEATCADYRAAASVDLDHDRRSRGDGHRIAAPLLVGWGRHGYVGRNFDVPAIWEQYADSVHPAPIEADHYVAEEAPESTLAALTDFWAGTTR